MDLSPEDALRVNVLLAGSLKAVRIDESRMMLHALSDKGEASIRLNPNCRDDAYLRRVRETLSSHVLGSPGGYPVYLKRWTRMGQARDSILESLLLLGEPEAVVAVVNATGITDEIASRAWWASQTPENARCMLRQQAVIEGEMGPVLAEFLLEFLPFEEEAHDQIRSVSLVLQGDLISENEQEKLWERARSRVAFYVGFLQTLPDRLPLSVPAHPRFEDTNAALQDLAANGNRFAIQLLRLMSPAGQAFLETVMRVLKKPANQDVVVELMHAMRDHARLLNLPAQKRTTAADIEQSVDALLAMHEGALDAVLHALPERQDIIRAMLFIGLLDENILNPVFSQTDAMGTVMRRKLKPVFEPIDKQIELLAGKA